MSRASLVFYRLAIVIGLFATGACAASERQRPISAGPVNSGAGSLEATRRQLAGTWTLTKFEVINAAGQLTAVRAKAQLTYDDFGNLSIKGVLEEPLPGQASIGNAPALAYAGRATIDVARKELILTGTASVEPSPEVLASIGIDQRRRYEVTGTTLTMSALDSQGRMTSRATYQK
jgi:hypothetical protein